MVTLASFFYKNHIRDVSHLYLLFQKNIMQILVEIFGEVPIFCHGVGVFLQPILQWPLSFERVLYGDLLASSGPQFPIKHWQSSDISDGSSVTALHDRYTFATGYLSSRYSWLWKSFSQTTQPVPTDAMSTPPPILLLQIGPR